LDTKSRDNLGMESKACKRCGEVTPLSGFYSCKTTKDGLLGQCKKCIVSATQARYQADPDKTKKRVAEWRSANKEHARKSAAERRLANIDAEKAKARAYYEANRRAVIDKSAAWAKANPERFKHYMASRRRDPVADCEKTMRRLAAKKHRTPPWVSKDDFVPVYRQCRELSEQLGVEHQVDHIVPLQGKNVSGLHVPWNLQIIPAQANQSKGNRFDPDAYVHTPTHAGLLTGVASPASKP
jgi:5-methylcytosine-specific restriction endonuclease McrA